jgi:ligand-binding sensor domain-containing protein
MFLFKVIRFILLISFSFVINNLIAQSPNFKNFTVEDGLPSSECYQVLQDKKGYIWIASDKGVARYDGYHFENFTLEDGLPENCIIRMYEDQIGRIWFAGLSGKLAYYQNNKIICLKINPELVREIKGGLVSSLAYVNNSLWLGTYNNNKSFRISFKKGKQKLILGKENSDISAYLINFNNKSYIYSWLNSKIRADNNFLNFNYQNNTITYKYSNFFTHTPVLNFNIRCTSIDKNYFILSFSNQLYIVNKLNGKVSKKHIVKQNVLYLFSDSKKGLWICTNKGGLLYYEDGKIGKTNPQLFLKNKSISCITEDREGGYWITSLEEGLYYINDINYRHIDELSIHRVNCITSSPTTLYAGLDNGKIVTYNGRLLNEIDLNNNSINSNNIRKIVFNQDKSLTVNGSTGIANLKNKINWFKVDGSFLPCVSFAKDLKDQTYWILGNMDVFHVDFLKNKILDRFNLPIKLYSMSQAKNDEIWLGTIEGLYSMNGRKLQFHGENSRQLSARINDLEVKKDAIWMATKEYGVCIKKGASIYQINTLNGLPSNICQSLTLESDKIGWIATNKGVCKVKIINWNPMKIELRTYNSKNGLISNEINEINKNGSKVYVASNNGISWFDENKVKLNKITPPIYINKVQINKKEYPIKNNYELSYSKNNISLSYIGLAYKNAGEIEYKYRLIGLDTNWNYNKFTKVEYTTLPYGSYTFEVLAKNNDGYWSEKPAIINFEITPPFWHTWIFRIITGLTFLSSIYFFIKWRVNKVEKRALENTRLYQQTVEMEMKFLSSQMNPHFTFNAMNSIQYYLMENEPEKAQKYLVKYSKLIRKVLENNMKKYVKLDDEIDMLGLYMDIESLRFEIQFDYEINIPDEIKELNISIPPMIIQPYIENAIWHGLSNQKEIKGKIALVFELIDNKIKCIIEDNGVGRKRSKELSVNNSKKESLGMLITNQRLQQLHSESEMVIEPEIIDLTNKNGVGCGTIVEIYLPFLIE